MTTLIIVESPAKCSKIESFLGNGYKCVASFGHIRELDSSFINTVKNIDSSFKPSYSLIESKKTQIDKLRKMISYANDIYLASDDDREGEAIAWHICDTFKLEIKNTKRIVFHEITETAVKRAINEPRRINMNIVLAQQSRQVLDMIVGYKLSPILWKNISQYKKSGLSAGRCQIPALRIVYDNQKEIETNPGIKVYNTSGYFTSKNIEFTLKQQYENEEKMIDFLESSLNHEHIFNSGTIKNISKRSPLPFTTSGLQQMAGSELRISPKDTMNACQKLYEGGYITYMRTDSVSYSEEFIEKAKNYITKKYGVEYFLLNNNEERKSNNSKTKKNKKGDNDNVNDNDSDSAHEAIRPTNIELEQIDKSLGSKEVRIYNLIRRNTLQSCMEHAKYKTIISTITAPLNNEYKYSAEQVVFPGWKVVETYEKENPLFTFLQTVKSGSIIPYKKITSKVGLKHTKSHYTESNLVQLLEKNGIGRPSTFSSIVEKIQEREYVNKEDVNGNEIKCIDFTLEGQELLEYETKREIGNEKNKLVIKPTGTIVLDFLLKHFDKLFEYEYTKYMEDALDLIAKGEKKWYELCDECLKHINERTTELEKNNKKNSDGNGDGDGDSDTSIKIDDNHTYIIGRYGPVMKCIIENSNNKGKKCKNENVIFKSVKPNLDIQKLKRREYTLDEILSTETKSSVKELGKYNSDYIYLKESKYGFYIEWRDIKKTIDSELVTSLSLDDAISILSKNESENLNIIRKVDDNTTIRKGKYGDYIFHKKKTWKKPMFLKLDDFVKDNKEIADKHGGNFSYRSCDLSILSNWIYTKYKL